MANELEPLQPAGRQEQYSQPQPSHSGDSGIVLTWIAYGLNIAAIFAGFPIIVAVILCYCVRGSRSIKGTYLESHINWLIGTFWWSLLWGAVSCLLVFFLVGWVGLLIVSLWILYRVAKGIVRLVNADPV